MILDKKNLFIINSPLQFLNACEAINFFKLKNIVFLLIYNRSNKNIIQLEEQIRDLKIEVDEIIRFYPPRKNRFFKYIKLIRDLKKYAYNRVFTGEIEDSNFRIIVINLKKEKLFLLDEGTSTIVDYETKIKQNKLDKYSYKEFKFLLAGLRIKFKDTINFFTYYDFEPLNCGEVIKNKLEYMRRNFQENDIDYSNTLFFLGQPMFIFSDKQEFKIILKNVINKYNYKKIFYIPHREDVDTINIIKDIYKEIEILYLNEPIEKYFLNNNIYPKHVISYSSTALVTTKILFKDCIVQYIKIKKPNTNLHTMKYLDIVYPYFDKNNILECKLVYDKNNIVNSRG